MDPGNPLVISSVLVLQGMILIMIYQMGMLNSELSRVSDRDLTTQDSMMKREQGGLATEAN